jgi:hypothetical protein
MISVFDEPKPGRAPMTMPNRTAGMITQSNPKDSPTRSR